MKPNHSLLFYLLFFVPLLAFGHDEFWEADLKENCSYTLLTQNLSLAETWKKIPYRSFPEQEQISRIIEKGDTKEVRQLMRDIGILYETAQGLKDRLNFLLDWMLHHSDKRYILAAARSYYYNAAYVTAARWPAWDFHYWQPGAVLLQNSAGNIQLVREALFLMRRAALAYTHMDKNLLDELNTVSRWRPKPYIDSPTNSEIDYQKNYYRVSQEVLELLHQYQSHADPLISTYAKDIAENFLIGKSGNPYR